MGYFLFPFGEVKKGSKIVLYAAGNVGQDYYRQAKDTDFCKIVMWVDENFSSEVTKSPDCLFNMCNDVYDLVIIAIANIDVANQIKDTLIQHKIPEKKILYKPPVFHLTVENVIKPVSTLKLTELISNTEVTQEAILDYFHMSDGDIDFFTPLINEIKHEKQCNDMVHAKIISSALIIINDTYTSTEAKIVLLRILFAAECFTPQFMQAFINCIRSLKGNLSQKYWLFIDTSYMWLYYPHILYDGFFTERKDLLKEYAEELQLMWNPPQYCHKDNRNICMLVHHMSAKSESDCFTKYIYPIANELHKREYNVHIIFMGSHVWDSGTSFLKPLYYGKMQTSKLENLKYQYDLCTIHYPKAATMRERQQEILDSICQLNPYCIIDASDECSVTSPYYIQNYPTIYLPLRNHDYSSSFFHKCVYTGNKENIHLPTDIKNQILYLPLYFEYIFPKKKFLRQNYNLSKNDIVIITVGSRIIYELSNDLIAQMCNLLYINKTVKWIIVGCNSLTSIDNNFFDLFGKSILFINYEDDLPGLFEICDIYLNPGRIGGGTTIAWAMQHGLAIVSPFTATAGVYLLGEDNSLPHESDLVPFIMKLTNDPVLIANEKKKCKMISEKWKLEPFIDGLVSGISSLTEKFTISQ